jgi:hypothetical protein
MSPIIGGPGFGEENTPAVSEFAVEKLAPEQECRRPGQPPYCDLYVVHIVLEQASQHIRAMAKGG